MSNAPEVFTTDPAETIEVDHGEAHHVEPELFGIPPFGIVAVAMTVLILDRYFWRKSAQNYRRRS